MKVDKRDGLAPEKDGRQIRPPWTDVRTDQLHRVGQYKETDNSADRQTDISDHSIMAE